MNMLKNPFIVLAASLFALAVVPLSYAADNAATAHGKKGVDMAQQGAFDQAIGEFTEAIKLAPTDPRFYRDRGGVYLTTKRFQEAAADFSKAVELAPKDYAGYSLRGAAESELLQLDQALVDLNKALELKPNDPQTLERRGLVYYRQKNYQASLDDYNNALSQNPTSSLGLSRRADTFVALNQFDKAQVDLEALVKTKPEDVAAQDRLNYVKQKIAIANAPKPSPGISVEPVATPRIPEKPMDPRMKIAIGAAAVLVLFIIIVLIVRRKGRGY